MQLNVTSMPYVIASYSLPSAQIFATTSRAVTVTWSKDYMYVAYPSRSQIYNCTLALHDAITNEFISKACINEQRSPYDMITTINGGAAVVGTCNNDNGGYVDYYDPVKKEYQASKCFSGTTFSSIAIGMFNIYINK